MGFEDREGLLAELRLERANNLLNARVFARGGLWIRRNKDPKNTTIRIPAQFFDESFMRHNGLVRIAKVTTANDQLEALITLIRDHAKRGLPTLVFFFQGESDVTARDAVEG